MLLPCSFLYTGFRSPTEQQFSDHAQSPHFLDLRLSNTLTLNLGILPSGSWLWGSHQSYSIAQFLGVHPPK